MKRRNKTRDWVGIAVEIVHKLPKHVIHYVLWAHVHRVCDAFLQLHAPRGVLVWMRHTLTAPYSVPFLHPTTRVRHLEHTSAANVEMHGLYVVHDLRQVAGCQAL